MMLEGAQGDAITGDISPPEFERDLYGGKFFKFLRVKNHTI